MNPYPTPIGEKGRIMPTIYITFVDGVYRWETLSRKIDHTAYRTLARTHRAIRKHFKKYHVLVYGVGRYAA